MSPPSLTAVVVAPFVAALLPAPLRDPRLRGAVRIALAVAAAALAAFVELPSLDALSAIFVALISTHQPAGARVLDEHIFPTADDRTVPWASRPAYFVLLGAFWSSMLLAVVSATFAGVWIGVSATTLATTFLVGYSGGKAALEAAWKYLVLCSFGIAIALLGMLLLGHAAIAAGVAPVDALLVARARPGARAALPPARTRGAAADAPWLRHQGRPGPDARLAAGRALQGAGSGQRAALGPPWCPARSTPSCASTRPPRRSGAISSTARCCCSAAFPSSSPRC